MPSTNPIPSFRARFGLPAFFIVAFVCLPLLAVTFRGGQNLHTYLHRWAAEHISIQSYDPGQIAIADRDADIAMLAEFIEPDGRQLERATAYYDQWQSDRDWAIFGYDLESIETDDTGHNATVTQTLRLRFAPPRADPKALLLERTEKQVSQWVNRENRWYLRELSRTHEETIEHPKPQVIRP